MQVIEGPEWTGPAVTDVTRMARREARIIERAGLTEEQWRDLQEHLSEEMSYSPPNDGGARLDDELGLMAPMLMHEVHAAQHGTWASMAFYLAALFGWSAGVVSEPAGIGACALGVVLVIGYAALLRRREVYALQVARIRVAARREKAEEVGR